MTMPEPYQDEPDYQNEADHMREAALKEEEELANVDNEPSPNLLLRDRAMDHVHRLTVENNFKFGDVDEWLDAVDKVEAKLATGVRMRDE